jgi:hypothetical protein
VKRHWLNSRFGIDFLAVGVVASIFTGLFIVAQDAVFLVTGAWPKLPSYRLVVLIPLAGVASIFWAVTFFIFRPGWPKVVAAALAISFGSYLVQHFVPILPAQLTALCIARVLVFCTPLLLVRAYYAERKAKGVAG